MTHLKPHDQSFLILLLSGLLMSWLALQTFTKYHNQASMVQAQAQPSGLTLIGQTDNHAPETQNQKNQ